ncbi:MAG: response regulator transcription factor [Candidatus Korobacteraceae bacterium]
MALTRILLVDDCEAWRRMVITQLKSYSDWQVISEATDGVEALQKTRELQPDLILLDIGLPKLNGIEAARQICAIVPPPKILFLTAIPDADAMREALGIGAQGYILKSDAARDLLPAVAAVIEGKRFVGSRFASCDAASPQHDDSRDPLHDTHPKHKADRFFHD